MIDYKIDVLTELKSSGYNPQRLRTEKLLGESAIQCLRHKKSVSFATLNVVCELLNCQPGDILTYVKAPAEDR